MMMITKSNVDQREQYQMFLLQNKGTEKLYDYYTYMLILFFWPCLLLISSMRTDSEELFS